MWVAPVLAWQALAHFDVSVVACAVDEAELRRLTALELRSVDAPALAVSYRCDANDVVIGLQNAESEIRIERRAQGACCDDVELERTFALLAAGLFKAAGPALSKSPESARSDAPTPAPAAAHDPPPPLPPIDELPPPAPPELAAPPSPRVLPLLPTRAPTWAPLPTAERAADLVDHVHVVGVSGRVLGLNLDAPEAAFGLGLDYRAWPWRRFGFGGYARAAFVSSTHSGGEVEGRLFDFGAVGMWRFAQWTTIALIAEAGGGLSLVSIEGQTATAGFGATSLFGATGHLDVTLSPTVVVDRTQIALPLSFGGVFRAPRGIVATEDSLRTFQLDGLWVGAALRVSLGFGERPSTSTFGRRDP